MTVQPVGGAQPIAEAYTPSINSMPLTEAAVLLMMKRRTNDLDAQVRGVMAGIEESTAHSEAIQQQIEALQLIKSAYSAEHPGGQDGMKLENIMVEWEGEQMNAFDLLDKLGIEGLGLTGGGSATSRRMRKQYDDAVAVLENPESSSSERHWAQMFKDGAERHFAGQGRGVHDPDPMMANMRVKGPSLDALVAKLESESRRVNSGNELQMVRMQSAMQQRSQVITMATQMIKSMADTNQAIARNM